MFPWLWLQVCVLALRAQAQTLDEPIPSGFDNRPEDWTEESHSRKQPLYEEVFGDATTVREITIRMSATRYLLLMDSLKDVSSQRWLATPCNEQTPRCSCLPEICDTWGWSRSEEMCMRGKETEQEEREDCPAPPPRCTAKTVVKDPEYEPVTLEYKGKRWFRVGLRFRGLPLQDEFCQGKKKLSFRLDFDKFEESFPLVKDQNWYGFGKVAFSSNSMDKSFLVEQLASEVLRDSGVAAARVAPYRVYFDWGGGSVYHGLYSLMEDPADSMIEDTVFMAGGNLYKPIGALWNAFHQSMFEKKSNEKEAEFDDVEATIVALNAQMGNANQWRTQLEKTFDVGFFLNWLAVSALIGSTDSYGYVASNYYVYGDPCAKNKLRLFSWEHSSAFREGSGVRLESPSEGPQKWPLISRLLSDSVYNNMYMSYLQQAAEGLFSEARFNERLRRLQQLISPSVAAEAMGSAYSFVSSVSEFESAVAGVEAFVRSQHAQLASVLRKGLSGPRATLPRIEAQCKEGSSTVDGAADIVNGLRLSELMYHPQEPTERGLEGYDEDDFEFIEFANIGSSAIDLDGAWFSNGISYTFPARSRIEPSGIVVLVRNASVMRNFYPDLSTSNVFLGEYEEKLSNKGELLVLNDREGKTLMEISWSDKWFPQTDGDGYSLVTSKFLALHTGDLLEFRASPLSAADWAPSKTTGGTPGIPDIDLTVVTATATRPPQAKRVLKGKGKGKKLAQANGKGNSNVASTGKGNNKKVAPKKQVAATTEANGDIGAVRKLRVSAFNDKQVRLAWLYPAQAPKGSLVFQVRQAIVEGGVASDVKLVPWPSGQTVGEGKYLLVDKLTPATAYQFQVTSYRQGQTSFEQRGAFASIRATTSP